MCKFREDGARSGGPTTPLFLDYARVRTPRSDRAHPHRQSLARRDRGSVSNSQVVAGKQFQSVAIEDRAADDRDLRQAEAHADAGTRAAAERNVCALRESSLVLLAESLRPEGVRLREDVGKVVARPGAVADVRPRGDGEALELKGLCRPPRSDVRRRILPEGLVDDHLDSDRGVLEDVGIASELVEHERDG